MIVDNIRGTLNKIELIEIHNTGMSIFAPNHEQFVVVIKDGMITSPYCEIPLDIISGHSWIQEEKMLLVNLKEDLY